MLNDLLKVLPRRKRRMRSDGKRPKRFTSTISPGPSSPSLRSTPFMRSLLFDLLRLSPIMRHQLEVEPSPGQNESRLSNGPKPPSLLGCGTKQPDTTEW